MTTRSTQILALVFVGALVAACGGAEGAAPKASSPAPERVENEAAEPRTVEEAQAQIDRFSAELGPKPRPPAPESSPTSKPTTAPGDAKADSSHLTNDSCASPCRALASMRRAVDALCRMTGETDNRCVDAKKTLADSVGRTSSCKCQS